MQESGDRGDSVVDLLFLPEKCFTSKSALLLMELVHGALKVCLLPHYFSVGGFYTVIITDHNNYCSVLHSMYSYHSFMYQPMCRVFTPKSHAN